MKQAPPLGGLRPVHPAALLGLLLPALALVAIGSWSGASANPPLQAVTSGLVLDSDGDALPDDQELTLNLSVLNPDNDQDTWPDAVELAHGSNPFDALDVPDATAYQLPGIAVTARPDGSDLRLCVVMHAPAGSLPAKNARFGLLLGGVLYPVPLDRMGLHLETFTANFGSKGSVEVWDMPFPALLLTAHGSATFVAACGAEGSSNYTAAEVLDLTGEAGTVLMRRKSSMTPGQVHTNAFTANGDQDTVHQPIPTASTPVPAAWFAGRVCYQRAVTVGVAGSRIIREVVEAECMPNWDSYCSPTCPGTVGTLVESIDPGTLIGG